LTEDYVYKKAHPEDL